MTAKGLFEALLTELNKVNAPSMLLSDYNYYINRSINQFINKRYNLYDINLQTTDDLRVLKASAICDVKKAESYKQFEHWGAGGSKLFGASYEVYLPLDYLHMLNCICIYKVQGGDYSCYDNDDYVRFAAKRLTADSWSTIINDYYTRPLPQRPYYYIHNVNTGKGLATNPIQSDVLTGTTPGTDIHILSEGISPTYYVTKYTDDKGVVRENSVFAKVEYESFKKQHPNYSATVLAEIVGVDSMNDNSLYYVIDYRDDDGVLRTFSEDDKVEYLDFKKNHSNWKVETLVELVNGKIKVISVPRTIKIGNQTASVIEKTAGLRFGNASSVRCEIRYGDDDSTFKLEKVIIDYIKTPLHIRLTLEQVNLTRDTSLVLEFPDYVCLEIINELVTIVMERTADPRLLTHTAVSTTIPLQAQQLSQPQTNLRVSQ